MSPMGCYVRQTLRAGPFRFNLSKSGVGVSAGVPGFRIGTGPRGNYVHVGRGGVYYRASLNRRSPAPRVQEMPGWYPLPSSEIVMQDMTGATAWTLLPTGADDLVAQLNEAARRLPLWPFGLLAMIVLAAALPGAVAVVALVAAIPLVAWLALRDAARRSVVVFYEVEGPQAQWLDSLIQVWAALGQAAGLWRINAAGQVRTTYQYKTNAGASNILSRARVTASLAPPRRLVTNIAVPSLVEGNRALHFLPDRLLVREGRHFTDVPYASLRLRWESTSFIESNRVPHDAQQIDTTWRYVNVKGGPDRRFKDNRQLPVMLYGRMLIATESGLQWIVDCSRAQLAEHAVRTIGAARAPAPAQVPEAPPELPTTAGS